MLKILKTRTLLWLQWSSGEISGAELLITKIPQILPKSASAAAHVNKMSKGGLDDRNNRAHPLVLTAVSEIIHTTERSHR